MYESKCCNLEQMPVLNILNIKSDQKTVIKILAKKSPNLFKLYLIFTFRSNAYYIELMRTIYLIKQGSSV